MKDLAISEKQKKKEKKEGGPSKAAKKPQQQKKKVGADRSASIPAVTYYGTD